MLKPSWLLNKTPPFSPEVTAWVSPAATLTSPWLNCWAIAWAFRRAVMAPGPWIWWDPSWLVVWNMNFMTFHTHRIHGAGILMLTWLGYIDGIHVTIYSSTMDPMGYIGKNHPNLMNSYFSQGLKPPTSKFQTHSSGGFLMAGGTPKFGWLISWNIHL